MSGWGRRATGRIERTQFEGDELLKSLEGRVNIEVSKPPDYEQWSRSGVQQLLQKQRSKQGGQAASRAGSACSSSCRHPWNKKVVNFDEDLEKQRQKVIAILQLQVKARKKSVESYRARQEFLVNDNIAYKEAIEGDEKRTHKDVKDLLKKYERFRGAVQNLNNKFDKERSTARKGLDEVRDKVNGELEGIQNEVDKLQSTLQSKQEELRVLRSYKDKVYPVKAIQIAELQKKIENLGRENEDDLNELESIIDIEKEKFAKASRDTDHRIKSEVTEKAIAAMHDSLKDMALQNMVMKKEIEEHKLKVIELEEYNMELEKEVKTLLADPKTDIRRQVYPHLYPKEPLCTPDMDVILDIPTQEWLPI
ncbi:uncharacterized protein C20orf96-like isoform X2 [Saccoglossus kowalevskii]|uniref:Uncharacterized protein C20orf96-like isoform X1 n=1 Tax=Saccoglossus kowalevskii TaxID=10224 RepID=A0ABM0H1Z1_SACKO|nr:PREDICTED: uncharacterized protein C20orf96-like isoform X1 [Saccoglossus kowalevskii]